MYHIPQLLGISGWSWGGAWSWGVPTLPPLGEMATAADSTHTTGMRSCLSYLHIRDLKTYSRIYFGHF